jgi:hypothetical protein
VVVYDVDANGIPTLSPAPVTFGVSCADRRAFRTEQEGEVRAAAPNELISGWHKVNGIRPRGAPVGITVASDGTIWLEDKNKSIVRIDVDPTAPAAPLGCDTRTVAQIDELVRFVTSDRTKLQRLTAVRTGLIEKHCIRCHSHFSLDGVGDAQRNATVLRYIPSRTAGPIPATMPPAACTIVSGERAGG